MRRATTAIAFCGLVLASVPVRAAAPDGAALYARHCAGCHGPKGRGDGPAAAYLRETPRDLRDGVLREHDTAALVRRIREGVPLAVTSSRRTLDEWLRDTEGLLDHLERLARSDRWTTIEGAALWEARCERCHGQFGSPPPGEEDMPVDLAASDRIRRWDDERLREAVRHGVPGMPAIEPPLREEEVRTLAAYVRLLSPGLALYTRVCAGCHGVDGRPVDLPPGLRKPVVVFDAAWLARTTRQERETAVWHMLGSERPQMPHLAEQLDAAEVRAIVVWLRQQP
jgi:mono/diheme cytochrome c family protein